MHFHRLCLEIDDPIFRDAGARVGDQLGLAIKREANCLSDLHQQENICRSRVRVFT